MREDFADGGPSGTLYVDVIEIGETVPHASSEAGFEAATLRSFLNVFNNQLYVVIENSRSALDGLSPEHPSFPQIQASFGAAGQLESAVKRLQVLVEGAANTPSSGTILVADDEGSLRTLVVKNLNLKGYTVLEASSGAEALRKSRGYPGKIHLILADVAMLPMDGNALVRQVILERPNIKAIYMSGDLVEHSRMMAGTEFLSKPTDLGANLIGKIRVMLERD